MKKITQRQRMRIGLRLEDEQSYIYNDSLTHAEIEKLPWYRILALKKMNVFRIFIAAIIFNFGIAFFLTPAETIPTGLSGVGAVIVFLVPQLKAYFGVIYLVLNAPILLFYWKKNSNIFNILTAFYLLFATFINSIFNIPVVNFVITKITSFVPGWSLQRISNVSEGWPIIVFAFIAGVVVGSSGAMLWQAEASSGGTDIFVKYYSNKYKKNVAGISRKLNLISALFYYLIYIAFRWNLVLNAQVLFKARSLFLIQFFATILFISISALTINFLFPNYKKVKVAISTNKPKIVIDYFKKISYWRGYTIFEGYSAYTGKKTYRIETVCLIFEAKIITKDLRRYDSSIWISAQNISYVIGRFR